MSPRYINTGRDWHTQPGSLTPWQSEQAYGDLLPMERPSTWYKVNRAAFHGPEHWAKSLAMWVMIGSAAIVVLAVFG